MRKVAVFDFDGTLTTRDTFLEFIKFACGRKRFFLGFLLHLPWLVLMMCRLYPNWKVKQKLFSWFFKGMAHDRFAQLGISFAEVIREIRYDKTHALLIRHAAENATIYIVSASIEEWIRPYCETLGVHDVLCTKIDVADGRLTGKFSSKNCFGQEKVNRLLEKEPQRDSYYLYAYGDSNGDREMLAFADEGINVKKKLYDNE